jgi:hypothetical protein
MVDHHHHHQIMGNSFRSGGAVDVLELQPLQQEQQQQQQQQQQPYPEQPLETDEDEHQEHPLHSRNSALETSTTTTSILPPRSSRKGEYRTLELILGLDEPISSWHTNGQNDIIDDSESRIHATTKCGWVEIPSGKTALKRYEGLVSYIEDYFYPPDIPRSIQLWRYNNICIPISYLAVGMMQGMLRPLLNVYPIDLGATEAQQTMIASIATLPSALKIIFGFVSDNVPICGYRRKPYMLFGWMCTVGSMIILLYYTNLSVPTKTDAPISPTVQLSQQQQQQDVSVQPKALPSMEWLMVTFFISGSGMWISDVMADAFVAQKVPYEPIPVQGQIQSTCYACRFFGIAAFAPLSTYLYNRGLLGYSGPATIVTILAITPLITAFPLWFFLEEERNIPIPSTRHQCDEIWKTVCSRSVWQPIGFVYLYNILQVPNAAWRQYLKSVLFFTSNQLNVLLTVSYFLLYLGTVVYKYCFLKTSWRRIYYFGFILNAVASCGQLALIRGYTFGIHPFFFALGDDAIIEFIVGIQMLPICILMVTLCPPNSEGASYAMFTTAWNSAMLLAQAIGSSVLLGIWDTSKETMVAGNVNGLFNLSVLTTLLQMLPILFVGWLPHGRTELVELAHGRQVDDGDPNVPHSAGSSRIGGSIFLLVVLSSVLYTIIVTLLNVLVPGWMGES